MNNLLVKNKLLIILLIIILVFFFLNVFQKQVRSLFYSFSNPILEQLWKAGDSTSGFFRSFGISTAQIEELNSENKRLLQETALLNELKKENKELRRALDLELEKEFDLEIAQIIGKDISQDFIFINKGSLQGLSENMTAITEEKVLVGKIMEVYDNSSKIMLLSNKEMAFDVKIQKDKNISGLIKGNGNFTLILDLIEEQVFENDIVITSFIGNIFPEALLVGRIREVNKNEVFYQAKVAPFFNISQAENIFIIK